MLHWLCSSVNYLLTKLRAKNRSCLPCLSFPQVTGVCEWLHYLWQWIQSLLCQNQAFILLPGCSASSKIFPCLELRVYNFMSSKSCTNLAVPSRGKTPPIPVLITPGSYFYPALTSDQGGFSPLFSKLPVPKSFAQVSGSSTAAIFHRGGHSTAEIPGWKQRIPAECRQHCLKPFSAEPGAVLTDIPSCPWAFPSVTTISAFLPAAGGQSFCSACPLWGVFAGAPESITAGVFTCRKDAGAPAGRAAPAPVSPSSPFPREAVPESIAYPFSLSHRSLVQLIFNSYTRWDNVNWGDEGNLVPGCAGRLLNSCLGRWKTHNRLYLSNQAEMDLKISPTTDMPHIKIDLGFYFLSPTSTTEREGTLVVCLSLLAASPIALFWAWPWKVLWQNFTDLTPSPFPQGQELIQGTEPEHAHNSTHLLARDSLQTLSFLWAACSASGLQKSPPVLYDSPFLSSIYS